MRIKELVEKGVIDKNHWLTSAIVKDEDVEVIDGYVVWRDGEWCDGIWHEGEWRGGIWHEGEWRFGTWLAGHWYGGTWCDGSWHGGIWCNGTWRGGVWCNGTWRNGEWCKGIWHGGKTAMRSKYIPIVNTCGEIIIACKVKTIKEWDEWFYESTEEYETPRGSLEFKMILAHYEAVKAYIQVMEK